MTFPIYQVIFFVFALVTVGAAAMVIILRNPVYSALFLVLTFVSSAVLWMMLQAEFLSLVLIFVYVGAVMTLFLFVVMMINIDRILLREKFVAFLPLGILVIVALLALLFIAIGPQHFKIASMLPTHYTADYNNTKVMGTLLFTNYLFPFEIAAVILLVAIVAAISLAFHGRKPDTKSQRIAEQHKAKKADRLRIIKMQAEKQ